MKHIMRWNILRLPILFALLWCVLTYLFYAQAIQAKDTHTAELALIQTRTLYAQIVDTRAWNAVHGGVYVEESALGQPNIWIPETLRSRKTVDGKNLVLVNPAYMSRQIADMAVARGGSFRITSQQPLRPENAADNWESQALALCKAGLPEVFALEQMGGKSCYRFMAPLRTESPCLTCHPNDTVGDVRGGISVTLDAEPFMENMAEHNKSLSLVYGLLGITGMVGIGGATFGLNYKRVLAEEASRIRNAFLANMSHDMRTPLNGIVTMTELLAAEKSNGGSATQKSHSKTLHYLHESAASLLEMVTDITDHAVLDAGRLVILPQAYAVREVLAACLVVFEPVCRMRALSLTLQVEDNVPSQLWGDHFRLRQALGNLISNAVKFTQQGSVRVQASFKAHESKQAGLLSIVVEDTGPGISPLEQERIFERFERGQCAVEQGLSGTGLGLGIAREIARLMGGTVTVESTVGQGSRFTLCVQQLCPPEESAQPLVVEAQPIAPTLLARATRILVAEDNAVSRYFLENVLKDSGYSVFLADNGAQVAEILQDAHKVDMLLLDLRMPGMDGISVARQIREGHYAVAADMPIMVLTASLSTEESEILHSLGVEHCLVKPVSARVLLRTLSALVHSTLSADQPGGVDTAAIFDRAAALDALAGLPDSSEPGRANRERARQEVLLERLCEVFCDDLPEQLHALHQAVATGNSADAQRLGHALKNSAASLYAGQLKEAAARMEKSPVAEQHSALLAVETAALTLLKHLRTAHKHGE